jgi:hypothetical protein
METLYRGHVQSSVGIHLLTLLATSFLNTTGLNRDDSLVARTNLMQAI